MKKILIVVLLLTALAFPLAAKTNLLNFGYNVQGDFLGVDGQKLRAIGIDYTYLGGDKTGFYFQANPYYATSVKNGSGDVFKLSDYDEQSFGSNFIFGFGGDLNFGRFGLILGGGVFLDFNYYEWQTYEYSMFTMTAGLGAGLNFYYHLGSKNFLINAGFSGAWRPLTYWFDDADSGSETFSGQSNFNFNIGVGWRTGGVGSKSKSSSSSDSGADDW